MTGQRSVRHKSDPTMTGVVVGDLDGRHVRVLWIGLPAPQSEPLSDLVDLDPTDATPH